MEKNTITELFNLRDKKFEFTNLKDFKFQLKRPFGKNIDYFLYIGPEGKIKDLKERGLPPGKDSDKLTVLNYFGMLKEIEENNIDLLKFEGEIFFNSIKSLGHENKGHPMLSAKVSANSSWYNLEIILDSNQEKFFYTAKSYREDSPFDKIASKFLGPNQE